MQIMISQPRLAIYATHMLRWFNFNVAIAWLRWYFELGQCEHCEMRARHLLLTMHIGLNEILWFLEQNNLPAWFGGSAWSWPSTMLPQEEEWVIYRFPGKWSEEKYMADFFKGPLRCTYVWGLPPEPAWQAGVFVHISCRKCTVTFLFLPSSSFDAVRSMMASAI